jgi:hypothetical protein
MAILRILDNALSLTITSQKELEEQTIDDLRNFAQGEDFQKKIFILDLHKIPTLSSPQIFQKFDQLLPELQQAGYSLKFQLLPYQVTLLQESLASLPYDLIPPHDLPLPLTPPPPTGLPPAPSKENTEFFPELFLNSQSPFSESPSNLYLDDSNSSSTFELPSPQPSPFSQTPPDLYLDDSNYPSTPELKAYKDGEALPSPQQNSSPFSQTHSDFYLDDSSYPSTPELKAYNSPQPSPFSQTHSDLYLDDSDPLLASPPDPLLDPPSSEPSETEQHTPPLLEENPEALTSLESPQIQENPSEMPVIAPWTNPTSTEESLIEETRIMNSLDLEKVSFLAQAPSSEIHTSPPASFLEESMSETSETEQHAPPLLEENPEALTSLESPQIQENPSEMPVIAPWTNPTSTEESLIEETRIMNSLDLEKVSFLAQAPSSEIHTSPPASFLEESMSETSETEQHAPPLLEENPEALTSLESPQIQENPSEEASQEVPSLDKPVEETFQNVPSLDKPVEETSQNVPSLDKPVEETSQNVPSLDKPVEETSQDIPSLDKPVEETSQNVPSLDKPVEETSQDVPSLDKPVEETSQDIPSLDKPVEEKTEALVKEPEDLLEEIAQISEDEETDEVQKEKQAEYLRKRFREKFECDRNFLRCKTEEILDFEEAFEVFYIDLQSRDPKRIFIDFTALKTIAPSLAKWVALVHMMKKKEGQEVTLKIPQGPILDVFKKSGIDRMFRVDVLLPQVAESEKIIVHCPTCNNDIQILEFILGKTIPCLWCQAPLKLNREVLVEKGVHASVRMEEDGLKVLELGEGRLKKVISPESQEARQKVAQKMSQLAQSATAKKLGEEGLQGIIMQQRRRRRKVLKVLFTFMVSVTLMGVLYYSYSVWAKRRAYEIRPVYREEAYLPRVGDFIEIKGILSEEKSVQPTGGAQGFQLLLLNPSNKSMMILDESIGALTKVNRILNLLRQGQKPRIRVYGVLKEASKHFYLYQTHETTRLYLSTTVDQWYEIPENEVSPGIRGIEYYEYVRPDLVKYYEQK